MGVLVYLKTRNTISGFFNGFIVPLCLADFFFLLPQIGIVAALLAVMEILGLSLLFFWLAHEYFPWLRLHIEHEQKILGGVNLRLGHSIKELSDE